jgi:hypothetical protein
MEAVRKGHVEIALVPHVVLMESAPGATQKSSTPLIAMQFDGACAALWRHRAHAPHPIPASRHIAQKSNG